MPYEEKYNKGDRLCNLPDSGLSFKKVFLTFWEIFVDNNMYGRIDFKNGEKTTAGKLIKYEAMLDKHKEIMTTQKILWCDMEPYAGPLKDPVNL